MCFPTVPTPSVSLHCPCFEGWWWPLEPGSEHRTKKALIITTAVLCEECFVSCVHVRALLVSSSKDAPEWEMWRVDFCGFCCFAGKKKKKNLLQSLGSHRTLYRRWLVALYFLGPNRVRMLKCGNYIIGKLHSD